MLPTDTLFLKISGSKALPTPTAKDGHFNRN